MFEPLLPWWVDYVCYTAAIIVVVVLGSLWWGK